MEVETRTLHLNNNFTPCHTKENDEIFGVGIFRFNISKIMEDIHSGELVVDKENINIKKWFRWYGHNSSLNEDHLPTVDVDSIIIQAEIRPGIFSIIDGNHRIEKAFRLGKSSICSFNLVGEQLIPYLITYKGYKLL